MRQWDLPGAGKHVDVPHKYHFGSRSILVLILKFRRTFAYDEGKMTKTAPISGDASEV